MKFCRRAASIAIYFIFTLLWAALLTNSSEDENKTIVPQLHHVIAQDFQRDVQSTVKAENRLDSISRHIIFIILKQFLTIQEILILRETCTKFVTVLMPNDKNMVMFCKNFQSKEMDEVPLIWFNLKYFLDQSYANALDKIEIFNIKKNTYAVLACGHDKKIISWCNREIHFSKMLPVIHKTKKELIANEEIFHKALKIYNKRKTAWVKITNKGKLVTHENRGSFDNLHFLSKKLKKVKNILSTWEAFAALLDDGSVIAWGVGCDGGKIPIEIQIQLQNVKMIFSTHYSFVALLNSRRIVAWGNKYRGGLIPDKIATQLQNVEMIYSTKEAFAALLDGSRVVAWGDYDFGGKIPNNIQSQLQNVKMIFSTESSFAALLEGGRVVAWGDENAGGIIPHAIQTQLIDVKMIFSNASAFVALLEDGSVSAWGCPDYGGLISDKIHSKLMNVTTIFPHKEGFTALCKNGDMLTWPWD